MSNRYTEMSDPACSDACLSVGFLFVTVHPKKVRRSDEGSTTLRVPPGAQKNNSLAEDQTLPQARTELFQ